MKLVELLARELSEWPSNAYVAVQDGDSGHTIWFLESDHRDLSFISGEWKCSSPFDILISRPSILASNHASAIVTRSDWAAERARIAKPAKKADKEGWIRHRGGKCPVEAGVMVDVRHRDGEVFSGFEAVLSAPAGSWNHANHPGDIMAYRLHKPAERVTPAMPPEGYGEVVTETLSAVDGPFQWRDRITEIDSTASALAIERAELVQKLASEGFALIGRINELLTDAEQKHEDMSDWRNWKAGDKLTTVLENDCNIEVGRIVTLRSIEDPEYDGGMPVSVFYGDEWNWPAAQDESGACVFKFHSRPSA